MGFWYLLGVFFKNFWQAPLVNFIGESLLPGLNTLHMAVLRPVQPTASEFISISWEWNNLGYCYFPWIGHKYTNLMQVNLQRFVQFLTFCQYPFVFLGKKRPCGSQLPYNTLTQPVLEARLLSPEFYTLMFIFSSCKYWKCKLCLL